MSGYCIPDCPLCHGSGGRLMKDPYGYETFEICPNSPSRFIGSGVTYEDLSVPKKLPQTTTLKSLRKELDALAKAGHGLIYITGGYGIGKSVMAKAKTAELARTGTKAIYARQSQMISFIREGYDEQQGQRAVAHRLKQYREAKWLVIDEIGRDRATDFTRETLAEIIDARYQGALSGKTMTVLVSNDKPEDVLQPYLVDRIRDVKNKVLVYKSESLRGKNV